MRTLLLIVILFMNIISIDAEMLLQENSNAVCDTTILYDIDSVAYYEKIVIGDSLIEYSIDSSGKKTIVVTPDSEAIFAYNSDNLTDYISKNITWPSPCQADFEGPVIISCIVDTDGSLTNIRILKTPARVCSLIRHTIEFVEQLPKWIPAQKGGKPVRSMVVFPVTYRVR